MQLKRFAERRQRGPAADQVLSRKWEPSAPLLQHPLIALHEDEIPSNRDHSALSSLAKKAIESILPQKHCSQVLQLEFASQPIRLVEQLQSPQPALFLPGAGYRSSELRDIALRGGSNRTTHGRALASSCVLVGLPQPNLLRPKTSDLVGYI